MPVNYLFIFRKEVIKVFRINFDESILTIHYNENQNFNNDNIEIGKIMDNICLIGKTKEVEERIINQKNKSKGSLDNQMIEIKKNRVFIEKNLD